MYHESLLFSQGSISIGVDATDLFDHYEDFLDER